MRRIHLYGHLAEQFGSMFELEVATAGEAIRALCVNFPKFAEALKIGSYELIRGEIDVMTWLWLELKEVNSFKLGVADFHILPSIGGSKNQYQGNSTSGGAVKLIIGVALLGSALFLGPLVGIGWMSGAMAGNVAMVGLALTVAGIARLLTPAKQDPNQQSSFSLTGPTNVYDQGNPVPVVYGLVMCGSQLISAAIDIEPIPVNWDPTNGYTHIGSYDPQTGHGVITGNPALYTQPAGNT